MKRPKCGKDVYFQYWLFWNCKNYEEYAVACDMQDMPKLWKKDEFDRLHNLKTSDKK